jgi:hypothetical protein
MNADQNSVEDYQFSLRFLWKCATDNKPDDVDSFLALLTLLARNALEGDTFQRQETEEQKTEYRSE